MKTKQWLLAGCIGIGLAVILCIFPTGQLFGYGYNSTPLMAFGPLVGVSLNPPETCNTSGVVQYIDYRGLPFRTTDGDDMCGRGLYVYIGSVLANIFVAGSIVGGVTLVMSMYNRRSRS